MVATSHGAMVDDVLYGDEEWNDRGQSLREETLIITIASPQIYSRHPVKVKVVTVRRNGQPPLGLAASRP